MPDIQFFQTRMGQRFFESTMPELVRQLTRLNDLLESIESLLRQESKRAPVPCGPTHE